MRFRKSAPKANFVVSVYDDSHYHVKTHRMPCDELNVVKKACHVNNKLKTFHIARCDLPQLLTFQSKYTISAVPNHVQRLTRKSHPPTFDVSKIPSKLWETLFDYQKVGVQAAIDTYGGRCLLADDMGLGKTRQALAFIGYHLPARVLVVCPSYLRYHWQHALKEWLDVESQLVKKGKESLVQDICVVSYDMLNALQIPGGMFEVVVCDESHYVKSRKTKRTKALNPVVRAARQALLITGTPALNRPIELFSQLHMLRPIYVKNYTSYAARYCNGKATPFGYDDRGSSNVHELNWILKRGFMIRRLKRDVLTQLPPKTRHTVWLEMTTKQLVDVREGFRQWQKLNSTIYKLPSGSEQQRLQMFERQKTISQLFRTTAVAKCEAIVNWVLDALAEGRSFIFFAYHRVVLDAVEAAVQAADISFMRIDGSTPAHVRQANVENFQTDTTIRIAILSLMAAGTGVTLTRVSECVFGELYWVPGVMIQAEDRVHRISQQHRVDIKYLLGTETLDTYVHPSLCKKLATLDTVVDNRSDRTFEGKTTTHVHAQEESLLDIISGLF
tara:strand:+ start:1106 stop:2779 length:1674 start_codon:yes stop_codon:yes gene_type:complete